MQLGVFNMKRIHYKILIICTALIVLSNFFPIKTFFELFVDWNHYRLSNGDGRWRFTEIRHKGSVFHFHRTFPDEMKKQYPGADTIFYRNFSKNPLAFWRYRDYFTDRLYTLPYKSRKDLPKSADWLRNVHYVRDCLEIQIIEKKNYHNHLCCVYYPEQHLAYQNIIWTIRGLWPLPFFKRRWSGKIHRGTV